MEADLDLVAQLDQIRLIQSDFDYDRHRFPRDKALPRYAAAFAEHGIRVGDDPAAVADRVAQRPAAVAAVMTASLDNWWLIAWSERDPTHAWLADVLRAADPDEWRARVRRAVQEKDRRALEALAAQDDADRQPPTTVTSLSWALLEFEAYDAAIALLKRAQQRHPADYWINLDLGHALLLRQPDHNSEALRFYSIARALRPDLRIYVNLAHLLIQEKDWDGAVVVARKALEAATASDVEGQALAWTNLGIGLERKGDWEGGRTAYRKAIELDRGQVHARFNLGHSFLRRGEVDAAIAAIEEAIQRSHADARVRSPGIEGQYLRGELGKRYCALGFARFLKQEYAAALTAYDRAIELNPRHLDSYVQRATALSAMGRLDDAVAAFEQAIRLDPRLEDAHFNLGKVFLDQGRPDRAVAAYARAVELNGQSAENHYSLGVALKLSGDRGGAVAAYRKALALDPNYAVAHWDLGVALVEQGAFREAVAALERGRRLGARPGGTSPEKYLERVRRYLALDAKLPAVLDGSEPPACAGERLEYAVVCQFKGLNTASARLYAEALAEEPALAAAPEADHRYQAARAAALAGRGRGNDAADLDAKERARLRKQALDWLRADLDRWTERLDSSKDGSAAVRAALERWGKDAALAGVREPAELAALPEAERSDYVRLWADVQSLLVRCLAKPRGR
jgi:tetratricopeptide (TPR) repeat protein